MPLATLLAGCGTALLNTLSLQRGFTARTNLAYGDGPRQSFDLYTPASLPPSGGFPLVVFFYGGSWNKGERREYRFVGEALASRGIVTMVADYRLYPAVAFPDFLDDAAAATAHAIEHAASFGANPARVFVMGHSAGGYNAAMVALDARWLAKKKYSPKRLAGWIGLAGAYDFLPTDNKDVQPVFHHPDYPSDAAVPQYTSRGAPPCFLGAARGDTLIDPQRNTIALASRLRTLGVPVTVRMYDHVNHMTLAGALAPVLRWLDPVLDDVARFINAPSTSMS